MRPVESAPLGEERKMKRQHLHLTNVMAAPATRLLPLLAVLDAVQAQANAESVFRTRRQKIQLHMAVAYAELRAERPRR